jgi:hypothetical protein
VPSAEAADQSDQGDGVEHHDRHGRHFDGHACSSSPPFRSLRSYQPTLDCNIVSNVPPKLLLNGACPNRRRWSKRQFSPSQLASPLTTAHRHHWSQVRDMLVERLAQRRDHRRSARVVALCRLSVPQRRTACATQIMVRNGLGQNAASTGMTVWEMFMRRTAGATNNQLAPVANFLRRCRHESDSVIVLNASGRGTRTREGDDT